MLLLLLLLPKLVLWGCCGGVGLVQAVVGLE